MKIFFRPHFGSVRELLISENERRFDAELRDNYDIILQTLNYWVITIFLKTVREIYGRKMTWKKWWCGKGLCAPVVFFFLMRELNPFESSARHTCSQTEPNYGLQDRLDFTVRPKASTTPSTGSRKEPFLRPLLVILMNTWLYKNWKIVDEHSWSLFLIFNFHNFLIFLVQYEETMIMNLIETNDRYSLKSSSRRFMHSDWLNKSQN